MAELTESDCDSGSSIEGLGRKPAGIPEAGEGKVKVLRRRGKGRNDEG